MPSAMPTYQKLTAPRTGRKITRDASGRLVVPDDPIIPFIEGDGTGPDIWAASVRVFDAAVEKAYGGRAPHRLARDLRGREGERRLRRGHLAARRHARGDPRVPGRHQGPAHHARRRRHPQHQRRPAPDPRPLRLRAAGALVRGRALAGEAARASSTWSSSARTRRTSTRASSASRARREAKKLIEFLDKEMGKKIRPDSGIGIKPISITGTERLVRMAIQLRARAQAQERHAGAQGQHHEVHRGRLPRLGLRAREARVPRRDRHRGRALGPAQGPDAEGQDPDQGPHRRRHVPAGAAAARRVRRAAPRRT